jgi:hypothetical protein
MFFYFCSMLVYLFISIVTDEFHNWPLLSILKFCGIMLRCYRKINLWANIFVPFICVTILIFLSKLDAGMYY